MLNNPVVFLIPTFLICRPQYPEQCVLREEVGVAGKLYLIFVVWIALVVVTTFYCYFCEQRLFSQRRKVGEGPAKKKTG